MTNFYRFLGIAGLALLSLYFVLAGCRHAGSWSGVVATPTPVSTPTFPKGERAAGGGIIDNTIHVPGPPCDAVGPTNLWTKNVDGTRIRVCAGQLRNYRMVPGPGAILVEIWPAHQAQPDPPAEYQVPLQAGRVRIVDVDGDVLTLQAGSGALFYFDLATRQWGTPTPNP